MKKVLILLLLGTACIKINAKSFEDIVVSDFNSPHSYYLSINIDSPQYNGVAIIETGDLLWFLSETTGLKEDDYPEKAKQILQEEYILNVGNIDFNNWGFIPVKNDAEVNKYIAMGIDQFIAKYFNGRIIKKSIADQKMAPIINQLFKWKIACKTDCETGYLLLYKNLTLH